MINRNNYRQGNKDILNKTENYEFLAASEIVTSPFLKFCKICGATLAAKGPNLYDFGTDTLHRCSGSKAERLREMDRRNV